MNVLTKSNILAMIFEQVSELNEMPNVEAKNWTKEKLENPIVLDLDSVMSARGLSVPVVSFDPETNELVPGKAIGFAIRTGPRGHRLLEFTNYEGPHKLKHTRFIEIDDDDNLKKTHYDFPRNKDYNTSWTGPEVKQFDNPEDQQKQDWIDTQRNAKRWVFRAINETFGDTEVVNQLIKCGIPRIVGAKAFTKQYTDVVQDMDFNGPELNFTITTKTDSENINKVIETIWNFRMAIDNGEELPVVDRPTKQIRAFAKGYPKSSWSAKQVLDSEHHAKLTDVLKLWMKAVKGGLVSFNAVTNLDVTGTIVNGTEYNITVNLSVQKNVRPLTKSRGQGMGNIIEPIRISHNYPLPRDVRGGEFTTTSRPQAMKQMLINIFEGVTAELMNLDPDAVLAQLISNPIEVETDAVAFQTDQPDVPQLGLDLGDDDF